MQEEEDGVDRDVKRQRHNEAEHRRRQRIKQQFDRLMALLVDEDKSKRQDSLQRDQYSVLEEAAELLQRQKQWIQMLRLKHQRFHSQLCFSPYQSLSLSSSDYAELFLNCPLGMAIVAPRGNFLDCNPVFENDLGYTRTEITQQTVFTLTPDHQVPFIHGVMHQLLLDECQTITMTKECLVKGLKYPSPFLICVFNVRNPLAQLENQENFFAPPKVKYVVCISSPMSENSNISSESHVLPRKMREGLIRIRTAPKL